MSKREPKYTRKGPAPDLYWLKKSVFRQFNFSFLGLTDLLKNKETFDGLAVILDLKDFTAFCDQREPHSEVPEFLNKFLTWLFTRLVKNYSIARTGRM